MVEGFNLGDLKLEWRFVPCPVCNSSHARTLFEDCNRREKLSLRSSYVECRECSMIYLSPAPRWEQLAQYYDWLYATQSRETLAAREERLGDRPGLIGQTMGLMRRFRFRPHSWPAEDGQGRRLLELGCGDGLKLCEFVERGWEVIGVDISRNALDEARRHAPSGKFYIGELETIGLPDGSIHVVRADNVLEHVPNPFEIAKQCVRLLSPSEGRLIIHVPNGRSLSMRMLGRYSNNSWIPFHLSLFSRDALHRMLSAAGFKRVDIATYSPIHALPSTLLQAIGRAHDPRGWGRMRWPVYLALMPVGWLSDRMGLGEELIAVART
jgi:SAM-dependent methyltransferase